MVGAVAGAGAGAGAAGAGAAAGGVGTAAGVSAGTAGATTGATAGASAGTSTAGASAGTSMWSSSTTTQGVLTAYNQGMKQATAVMAYKDAIKYSKQLLSQGKDLFEEAMQDAALTRKASVSFAAKQKVDYLSSGVEIGGSAAIVISDTKVRGEKEASAMEKRARNLRQRYEDAARQQVKVAKRGVIASFF